MADTDLERARLHATLRYAVGVSVPYVFCEFMQWTPTFLGAVLASAVIANLPMRPPLKLGLVLILSMAIAALYAALLTSLLRFSPGVMFGVIALSMFLAFHGMLTGRAKLPMMLITLCLATIPVIVMVQPAAAGPVSRTMLFGIVIAILATWLAWALFPRMMPPAAPPPGGGLPSNANAIALMGTAAVLPQMLACLMFGVTEALPMLVASVMIVTNFDQALGRKKAMNLILANFAGGVFAIPLHAVLLTTPTLPFLALLLFAALLGFGRWIAAGGPDKATAMTACNAMMIIFGSANAAGPGSMSLWLTRMTMFTLAGLFAVGMMSLVFAYPRLFGGR
jgi:hypothetical protein